MRLSLRWLAILLPVLVVLTFLYRTHQSDPNLAAESPSQSIADDTKTPAIQAKSPRGKFWQKWSHTMYEYRPDGPAIKIKGTAATIPPSDPKDARKPYNDRVSNSGVQLELLRLAHQNFFRRLKSPETDADKSIFKGRGVVMVGGGEYFGPAIIGIQMLRRTGSNLPVEVFVPNAGEYEKDLCEDYLPKLNAKCVVLAHFQPRFPNDKEENAMEIKHYQLKAPCLLLSSFEEVLLLDSDSMPMVDPKLIFESEPYLSKGLINWPDFWEATESPRFWDIAGLSSFPANLPPASSESGQLVINKRTHLASLLLATYYNLWGHDYYYPLLSQGALGQGDKETFMAAAVVLGEPYYRVKTRAQSLGRQDGQKFKGTAIVQHLPADDASSSTGASLTVRPAFLHCNTPKMNAGHLVDEGDLVAGDGQRLRLLGSKADIEKLFGYDVEDTLWDLLVQTGCELAETIREWKPRKKLCERLQQHHQAVFADGS